jgi:Flp pilus assembly protein TadD
MYVIGVYIVAVYYQGTYGIAIGNLLRTRYLTAGAGFLMLPVILAGGVAILTAPLFMRLHNWLMLVRVWASARGRSLLWPVSLVTDVVWFAGIAGALWLSRLTPFGHQFGLPARGWELAFGDFQIFVVGMGLAAGLILSWGRTAVRRPRSPLRLWGLALLGFAWLMLSCFHYAVSFYGLLYPALGGGRPAEAEFVIGGRARLALERCISQTSPEGLSFLQHKVQIHEIGEEDGQPVYVTDFLNLLDEDEQSYYVLVGAEFWGDLECVRLAKDDVHGLRFRSPFEKRPRIRPAPDHRPAGEATNDVSEAVRRFQTLVQNDPSSATAHTNLGVALAKSGSIALAIAEYRKAIQLDPKLAEAHANLGNELLRQGKVAEGIREERIAIQLKPSLPEAHTSLGSGLLLQGAAAQAIRAYREALRLDPDDAEKHNNLGTALEQQGNIAEAEREYREALRLDPGVAAVHSNLGGLLQRQGDTAGVVMEFKKAVRLDPGSAELHSDLGSALSWGGDVAGAIKEYREAIRLDAKCSLAHLNLGRALIQSNPRQAAHHYREFIRLRPNAPEVPEARRHLQEHGFEQE